MQLFDLPEETIQPDAIAFSPDGRWLAVTERGRVFTIDASRGTVRTLWPDKDTGYGKGSGIGFTSDSRGVIVHHDLSPKCAIEVHDIDTGAVQRDFALNKYEICEVGCGGRLVYIAGNPKPGWATVEFVRWNPLTGERLPAFARHTSSGQRLAVSADETWLLCAGGREIRLWNLTGKKLPSRATKLYSFEPHLVVAAAISVNGSHAAAGIWSHKNDSLRVCEVRTGEWKIIGERPHDLCRDLAFHPSRPVLAHRGKPGEVVFYDVASHAELKRYAWPLNEVRVITFAADGLRCAAAGIGKVMIWDVDV